MQTVAWVYVEWTGNKNRREWMQKEEKKAIHNTLHWTMMEIIKIRTSDSTSQGEYHHSIQTYADDTDTKESPPSNQIFTTKYIRNWNSHRRRRRRRPFFKSDLMDLNAHFLKRVPFHFYIFCWFFFFLSNVRIIKSIMQRKCKFNEHSSWITVDSCAKTIRFLFNSSDERVCIWQRIWYIEPKILVSFKTSSFRCGTTIEYNKKICFFLTLFRGSGTIIWIENIDAIVLQFIFTFYMISF